MGQNTQKFQILGCERAFQAKLSKYETCDIFET